MIGGRAGAVVLVLGLAGIFLVMERTTKPTQPRGIRNNNPGNIRWNGYDNWRGMLGVDPGNFVIFDTPTNGIRAMARVLMQYEKRGIDTIIQIVGTWAPAHENNVDAYTISVAEYMGIPPHVRLDRGNWPDLIAAIIRHENGQQPYTGAQIVAGIEAA